MLKHINEEAKAYAYHRCFSSVSSTKQEFHAAVEAFIGHLWHDSSEKPEEDNPLLLEMVLNNGSRYKIGSYGKRGNDVCFVADCSRVDDYVWKWAYIDDLFDD